MEITTGVLIQIAMYFVTFGIFVGTIKAQIKSQGEMFSIQIKNLTEKVEKHNGVIERTYKLENACGVFENRIKVSEHRIDDLEGGENK